MAKVETGSVGSPEMGVARVSSDARLVLLDLSRSQAPMSPRMARCLAALLTLAADRAERQMGPVLRLVRSEDH